MRVLSIAAVVAALTAPLAYAQVNYDPTPYVPRVTVAGGYQFLQANAPPGVANHFTTNGGFLSAGYTFRYWLRAVGEVTGSHGNNIGPLGQNLTLITYTFGPEVVLHARRFEPYAHALVGSARGSDSYFPRGVGDVTSATSFAYQFGGGLDYNLNHRISIRAIEAQYLHTAFPNGTDDSQNHLMLGAGIVFKFRGSLWSPGHDRHRDRATRKSEQQATALAAVTAAPAASSTPVAPSPDVPSPSVAAPAAMGDAGNLKDRVKDALFDYDSYVLRPDAVAVIEQDAVYLKAHPQVRVVIGGYSDERGTAEYNLALGEKRAQVARDALVARGVSPDQMDVISYGKEVQICTAENEACFQQNRRAGFEPRR